MNYELAKQLKEAGFPQIGEGNMWLLDDPKLFEDERNQTVSVITRDFYVHSTAIRKNEFGVDVYIPTLEELMEACESEKNSLSLGYGGIWRCSVETGFKNGAFIQIKADGKTPSEAVAKLWLELNK